MEIFNTELFLNIHIHVTILFLFLSLLFYYVIRVNTEEGFNSIIINSIRDYFDKNNKDIETNPNNQLRLLYSQFINLKNPDSTVKKSTIEKIKSYLLISSQNNDQLTLFVDNYSNINNNFDLKYYENLFQKDDNNRNLINNLALSNIIYVNLLLFFFFIFISCLLIINNNLTFMNLFHIFGENILVFIFIGIFEYLFFINIATKYLASPPSELFITLIDNLKKYLSS